MPALNPLPRTILVADSNTKYSYSWYPGADKISKSVSVITHDDLKDFVGINFPKEVKEGDILILHPFDGSRYVNINRVSDLENSKFLRFTEIAQLLGAKEYKIVSGSKYSYRTTIDAKGNLKVPTKKVEVGVNIENENEFKKQMGFGLTDTFKGVYNTDERDYKRALALVKKYNFEDEETLLSLIKTRNPNNSNIHYNRTVICDITQEINKTLDIALSLSACCAFSIDSAIKCSLEERIEKRIEMTFSFPER